MSEAKFGETLRRRRQKSGVTLLQLANELGWSVAYVSDIERGRRDPPGDHFVRKAARLIGCNEEHLLEVAWIDRGHFELSVAVSSALHHRVGSKLALRWEALTEDQLRRILDAVEPGYNEDEPSR
jgi:transcriptional regulator with XRE-family HTH domain